MRSRFKFQPGMRCIRFAILVLTSSNWKSTSPGSVWNSRRKQCHAAFHRKNRQADLAHHWKRNRRRALRLDWDEPGPFATQLNREHTFINPAMILMYVPERRSEQVHLVFGDIPDLWNGEGPGIQADERMDRAHAFSSDFPNYDALADAPIEMGKFDDFSFQGLALKSG